MTKANLSLFARSEALKMWDAGCDTLTIARALSVHESIVDIALREEREKRRLDREWNAAAPKEGVSC